MTHRVLVVSDTHNRADLRRIAELARDCEVVLHLGDGWTDGQRLMLLTDRPVIQVSGNADFPLEVVPEKQIEIAGWPIYLTHGHLYGVKRDLGDVIARARHLGCRLALFGHAHRPIWHLEGNLSAFCPSSAAYTYDGSGTAIGLLELSRTQVLPAWIPIEPLPAAPA